MRSPWGLLWFRLWFLGKERRRADEAAEERASVDRVCVVCMCYAHGHDVYVCMYVCVCMYVFGGRIRLPKREPLLIVCVLFVCVMLMVIM
jgi:hypothetical protein